jgi:CobQ-like glutamine amidotransferase family enzyme
MQFEFKSTDEVVHGEVLRHESVTQSGSGTGHVIFGGMNNEEDEKDGIYWFYNQFIVTGYEDGPIRFEVTWAPPKVLEEPVIVPLELE